MQYIIILFWGRQWADCGAGIGRVSKHLLLPRCAAVHLVEQSPRLLNASEAYIGPDAARTSKINIGLQVSYSIASAISPIREVVSLL